MDRVPGMGHLTFVLNSSLGNCEGVGKALMPSGGWSIIPHRDKSHIWISEEEKLNLLSTGNNQYT